jgi:hypothetical protein
LPSYVAESAIVAVVSGSQRDSFRNWTSRGVSSESERLTRRVRFDWRNRKNATPAAAAAAMRPPTTPTTTAVDAPAEPPAALSLSRGKERLEEKLGLDLKFEEAAGAADAVGSCDAT